MKRITSFIFPLLMLALPGASQSYDMQDVEDYISCYKEVAILEMERTGIPASITLAQGIIESAAGKSLLATEANNHFGIKCHTDWKGEGYKYDDDRKNECFRKYDSTMQSFRDHSDFLKYRQRYAVLFTYDPMDYKAWAKGLKSCGYATNPQYAQLLIKCIEDYDLHQWDMNEEQRSEWFASLNKTEISRPAEQTEEVIIPVQPDPGICAQKEEVTINRVFVFNDIKTVTLQKGESLPELATSFRIGMNRLMRYNDITDPSQLKEGDRVYLQPKRHHGDEKNHIVKEGETMFSIARDHGIQLQKLYEKNKMILGTQPATGEVLSLSENRAEPPLLRDQVVASGQNVSFPETYIVQAGDTLYSISRKHNLTIEELKSLNSLSSNELRQGTRLKVASK